MDSETKRSESFYEFLGWLEAHKKQVAIGAGAVLVTVGVIATVVWYKGQQEFAASEALSNIRVPYHPSDPVPPGTADKLRKLSADHAGTAAGTRAELILATLLYTDGKYAEAQTAFERFLREHPESQWMPQAAFGAAVCLDAQGKTNDALLRYEDFCRRYQTDPNADQARLHLATLYEAAGKPAQALEQYTKLTKATTFTPSAAEAQERQRLLLSKHPELAPTNTPSLLPTPTSQSLTSVVTAVKTNVPFARTNPIPRQGTNAPLRVTPGTNPPLRISPRTNAPAETKPK